MSDQEKWYEKIVGIDAGVAIKNSGSEEAFSSVLRIFYDNYDDKAAEIQEYYDTGDWKDYTIKVHALKSGSRLIGALKLGDDAEALEMAGKNSDIGYIKAHHEELMEEYRGLWEELSSIFGVKENRPDISPKMLADAYEGLGEFAELMDYELARMVIESVREFTLPPEDEKRFTRLRMSLSRMDWDGIRTMLKERN